MSQSYQELLKDLKCTVEGLLATQVANVWSIYGGLNRLHNSVDKIFNHSTTPNQNYMQFIQGLEWLQPESSKSYFTVDCEYKSHLPPHLKQNKHSSWLYNSLENHSLSQKLSWLLSDKAHLASCYQPDAFLRQEQYADATLICLRAVERNQASLMSEVNPCLFLHNSINVGAKAHRRCSSVPENQLKKLYEEKRIKAVNYYEKAKEKKPDRNFRLGKFKLWHSMPSLRFEYKVEAPLCKTMPSTPVNTKKVVLKKNYSKSILKKNKHVLINNCDIIEHTPTASLSSSHSSGTVIQDTLSNLSTKTLPTPSNLAHSPRSMIDFLPMAGEKDYRKYPKKSFIEDGGLSVLPMATGYFPKPTKGQSLLSFLTSSQFERANAELDRENAHFSIADAIISAVEQIRCKKEFKLVDELVDESDPEIMDLKQRIRMRRRQKIVEKHRRNWVGAMLSDGRTDTTTSVSPCSSSSDYESSDDVDDLQIDQASNLTDNSGLSMSMASLYSEADLLKRPRGAPDGASDILSAEGVALSLISKFSEKQLPRASDLEWLVSEEDAPQALLPLPKSWPISPDDSDKPTTPLRGTLEWAPPRPQIIFTLHPNLKRKVLMEKQNYKCAGCSMKVATQYASKFRYCDYLGRYFCTGCHTNQLAVIPGRVLQKWDFARYPVSTFSYRLLEQMYADPLFRIFELNKSAMKLSNQLVFCRKYRLGLYYLKDYIYSCKAAELIQYTLETHMPSYVQTDPEVYSMQDLVQIKSGEMKSKLKHLVEICCVHTSECKLCLARGFICEVCKVDDIIFPWQMRNVSRCNKCGTCFHLRCWKPGGMPCLKCQRITKRKESLTSTSD